jgi:sialate O-acetylesterase
MIRRLMLLVVLMSAAAAQADVRLPAVFGDHMVLQRDKPVPVWGWADAGEKVTIRFGDHIVGATADDDGRWRVELPALDANANGRELTVAGENTIVLDDVVVGEVWLCSGQSNMAWPLSRAMNAEAEIAAADYPLLRLMTVRNAIGDEPQDDVASTGWAASSPQTAGGFSAVAFFFGRDLLSTLDVPIGLIHSSWGGTPAQAWTPIERLANDPDLAPIMQRYEQALLVYDERRAQFVKDRADYQRKVADAQQAGADRATILRIPRPRQPLGPDHPHRPGGLYNAMIHGLAPFALRGAIWYQGESNAGFGVQYRTLLATMIDSWRALWRQDAFHFGIVQLANYQQPAAEPGDDHWAELREAQAMTAANDPQAGLALAIDIGEAGDIHPTNKQDVGKRLALWARAQVYGESIAYSGPIYRAMRVDEQGRVHLSFDHAAGLKFVGDAERSFAIAGEDQKWVWADARINGNEVIVWSDDINEPAAVRYGWSINPPAPLYNGADLPAVPFRTDDWPVASEELR